MALSPAIVVVGVSRPMQRARAFDVEGLDAVLKGALAALLVSLSPVAGEGSSGERGESLSTPMEAAHV